MLKKITVLNVKVLSNFEFQGEITCEDLTTEELRDLGLDPNDPANVDISLGVYSEFSMSYFDGGEGVRLASTDQFYVVEYGAVNILVNCDRFDEVKLEAELIDGFDWAEDYEDLMDAAAERDAEWSSEGWG